MKTLSLVALGLLSFEAFSQSAQKLPPKQKKTENTLGQSQAMDEVRRMTESSAAVDSEPAQATTQQSTAVSSEAAASLSQSATTSSASASSSSRRATRVKPARPVAPPPVPLEEFLAPPKPPEPKALSVPPQQPKANVWLVLDKGPEMGLLSGWTMTRKELGDLVGDGFNYGFYILQEIQPQVSAQFRLSGSRHSEQKSDRKSSLNIFPFEVSAQFGKDIGDFRLYVQPGLGGVLWNSNSERLIDQRLRKASGFDFMGSGGLGLKFIPSSSPWRLGADVNLTYVSGYFDNYLTRLLVYTSYQF